MDKPGSLRRPNTFLARLSVAHLCQYTKAAEHV